MESTRLRIVRPVLVGSVVRSVGDVVEVSGDHAEALIEHGLAVFADNPASTPTPEDMRKRRADRTAALFAP